MTPLVLQLVALAFSLSAPRLPASYALPRCTSPALSLPAAGSGGVLSPGDAIEVWHEGSLSVGNFVGRAADSKKTLEVLLSCGRTIKIDAGQIVDVWSGEGAPHTPDEWTPVREQCATLLMELPPHMLDLRPLWQRLFTQRESKNIRLDSSRVAAELFRSPHAEAARGSRMAESRAASADDAVTLLGERMAAAQLLADERTLFKRVPVEVAWPSLDEGDVELRWSRGGFKALPRATASSNAEIALIKSMKDRLDATNSTESEASAAGSAWPPSTLPLLAELELAALGLCDIRKQVTRVLSAFDRPNTADGARALLIAAGQWNEGEEDAQAALVATSGVWIDPFPKQALEEGAAAAERTVARRMELSKLGGLKKASGADSGGGGRPWWLTPPGQSDVPGGSSPVDGVSLEGRVDLRGRFARAFAIDTDATDFRDDAISYDAPSGTLAVHICDMTSAVPPGSLLDDVARLRLQTLYSGVMPLHMLPPPLLRECALSSTRPNECMTALLQLDAFGRVRHSRLVRSVIPPVRVLSYDEVDKLLVDTSISSQVHSELKGLAALTKRRALSRSKPGGASKSRSRLAGAANANAADANANGANRHLHSANAANDANANGNANAAPGRPASVRWRRVASDGSWRPELVTRGQANTMVDESLAMFSYAAKGAARRNNLLRLPQTELHRIGTAPLRRYSDLVAQRQLASVLRGESGMSASEVAALDRWIRQKRSDIDSRQSKRPQPQLLRALEAHCARQASATGAGVAVLDGTVSKQLTSGSRGRGGGRGGGRGRGGRGGGGAPAMLEVYLDACGVAARAAVRTPAQQRAAAKLQIGAQVRVRLRSVDARRGTVDVDLLT